MDAVSYPAWPVLEFRFRMNWNEDRRRLKLRLPTALGAPELIAEIPAGAIGRPADGQEHVHGRWLVVEGRSAGKAAAVGLASSGQHGLDFLDGEVRLSVLRASAYCHERGFDLDGGKGWKFADIGVHEFKLLVTAGAPAAVRAMMPGLADYLAAPPAAYAHLPYGAGKEPARESLLSLRPAHIRMLACKISRDGRALIIRLHEAIGKKTKAELAVAIDPGHGPEVRVPLAFAPFEIKTLRIEKDGSWRLNGVGPQE